MRVAAGLILPTVLTSGTTQRDYLAEPSITLTIARRFAHPDSRLWYGLRIAALNGSGIYRGESIRYNYTYFGPSLSYSLFRKTDLNSKGNQKLSIGHNPIIKEQSAIILSFGFSLSNRYVRAVSPDLSEADLQNRDLLIDGPGLWAEAHYSHFIQKELSFDPGIGIQSSKRQAIHLPRS